MASSFLSGFSEGITAREEEVNKEDRTLLIIEAVSRELHRIHQERALEGFLHRHRSPATSSETGS